MWAAKALAAKDIDLGEDGIVKQGSEITITNGKNEKYALWRNSIWDLPEQYVGEIIHIYSES